MERQLTRQTRGVTTLHHYERISSRDLEWHQRENGRQREEVKLSCFFDKRVKPRTLRGWTTWKKGYNRDEQSWKHFVIKRGTRKNNFGQHSDWKEKELNKNLVRWGDTWRNHNILPSEQRKASGRIEIEWKELRRKDWTELLRKSTTKIISLLWSYR